MVDGFNYRIESSFGQLPFGLTRRSVFTRILFVDHWICGIYPFWTRGTRQIVYGTEEFVFRFASRSKAARFEAAEVLILKVRAFLLSHLIGLSLLSVLLCLFLGALSC